MTMKKYINNTEKTENERLEELMEKFSDKNFAYDGDHKIYILNDYMDEDGERFKTLDEAKECLIAEFNECVARNLDEVE